MFNSYVWKLYLDAGECKTADKFKTYLSAGLPDKYISFIYELHKNYCPSESILRQTSDNLNYLQEDLNNGLKISCFDQDSVSFILDIIYDCLKNDWIPDESPLSDQRIFDIFSGSVSYFTTLLAIEAPDKFIPYYFTYNFNVLQNIADEFDISLPAIPQKKEYKARFYYYGKICETLTEFRQENNLSPYELCAFLYDFAPNYIGGTDSYIIKNLPEPRGAFLIGGSSDDRFLSKTASEITAWQCSPDTHAGDMIIMYLRSPISAIDSVWKSVSVGFNDPFFYYYRCVYIAHPVKLNHIPFKQLKADRLFKNVPIVRKNMQGVNGVELKPSEYNHLLALGKAKRSVPRLKGSFSSSRQKIVNEKDVENKLIKPLLKKLGYSESDYIQQLYVRVGNHNHLLIPDFVLLPERKNGHQKAFAVIEAKYSVNNDRDLNAAKLQARSYAVQLRARYSIIISKEGVWISTENDDFIENIFQNNWENLKNSDTFSDLFKLLGKS